MPSFKNQIVVVDAFGQTVGVQILATFAQGVVLTSADSPADFLEPYVERIGDDAARKKEHPEAESKDQVLMAAIVP